MYFQQSSAKMQPLYLHLNISTDDSLRLLVNYMILRRSLWSEILR